MSQGNEENYASVSEKKSLREWHHPNEYKNLLEEQFNNWANSICENYRIPKGTFRINLVNPVPSLFPVLVRIQNGAVVQIHLTMPWVDKSKDPQAALVQSIKIMKKIVRRSFDYLSDPRKHQDDEMFNPLILSDTVHEYTKGSSKVRGTWNRSKSDPHDFSGFRRRDFKVEIHREIKVTVTHKQTKMSYSLVDTSDRPEYDLIRESLEKCIEVIDVHMGNLRDSEEE